ncbi:MAG: O-antigen ligase family protein [Leptolyngbyaceae cyanobacterium bins.59]|nr:O-antigen ligase family protein [Leptolyngbyaceae cyanobacterium bins.59]
MTSIWLCARYHSFLLHKPLILGFIGLTVWLITTAIFAVDVEPALLGLFNFVPGLIVFAGFSCLFQSIRQLRQIAWLLILTTVPIVLIGMGQLFWGWAGHPKLFGIVLDLLVDRGGNPPGRMASIFQYANSLAAYLLMVFCLGLGLWFEAWDMAQAKNNPFTSLPNALRSPALIRLSFLSLILVGVTAAILLTSSRNAWFLGVTSFLVFAIYRRWTWIIGAIGVGISCIGGASFGPDPLRPWLRAWVPPFLWARLSDEMFQNRPVPELRTTQWQFAWSMVEQRPWTGWGLRSFTPLYEAAQNYWIGHPHNLFLMIAAESGLISAFLLFGLVGFVTFRGILHLQFISCQQEHEDSNLTDWSQPNLIWLAYLVAFGACTLFNVLDVTIFDVRLNLIGWSLLAAINGVLCQQEPIRSSTLKSRKAFKF